MGALNVADYIHQLSYVVTTMWYDKGGKHRLLEILMYIVKSANFYRGKFMAFFKYGIFDQRVTYQRAIKCFE